MAYTNVHQVYYNIKGKWIRTKKIKCRYGIYSFKTRVTRYNMIKSNMNKNWEEHK